MEIKFKYNKSDASKDRFQKREKKTVFFLWDNITKKKNDEV